MLKHILFALTLCFFIACQPSASTEQTETASADTESSLSFHGAEIDTVGAVSLEELVSAVAQRGEVSDLKIKGEVQQVCEVKGCWMTMDLADGSKMRVRFKDYGFFVPTTSAHKIAYMEGIAKVDTTSVEDQRHYAMDGGMSEEEAIASITEPKVGISFEASGVVLAQP